MSTEEKHVLMTLCETHSKSQLPSHYDDGIPDNSAFKDVLGGSQPLDISHAGGEFQELAKQVLKTVQTKITRHHGQGSLFEELSASQSMEGDICTSQLALTVFDIFCAEKVFLPIFLTDPFVVPAMVQQGAILCSPVRPMHAFTVNSLEFFCITHKHSPHLSIQAFVKTLCDLQGVTFQPYHSRQFAIAFNQCLQIQHHVQLITSTAIH
ncbi:hypothetical protein ID866_11443 [Astraeus odoratus]|nr:hypothetical protein ID866_11443 [Astraeus odoratus]